MQRFEIDARLGVTLGTKHPGSPFQKLRFPLRDLIGMDVKLLRQVGQCQLALDGGQTTLALNAGVWFRRGRLLIVSPVQQPSWPLSGRNSTYPAVQISGTSSAMQNAGHLDFTSQSKMTA